MSTVPAARRWPGLVALVTTGVAGTVGGGPVVHPGTYNGNVRLTAGGTVVNISVSLQVSGTTISAPNQVSAEVTSDGGRVTVEAQT